MDFLSPIPQVTLTETVTEKLRDAIIRGELVPGQRITEPSLAISLAVSRSPVREAITRLLYEGLLVRETKSCTKVWIPIEDDVDEILSMRVMMETLAAELTIKILEENDFCKLEELYNKQEKAIHNQDHLLLSREDKKFHDYIIFRTNHKRLIESWNLMMCQWEVLIYRWVEYNPDLSGTVLTDHRNIIEALKSRDLGRVIFLHRDNYAHVSVEIKDSLGVTK